MYVMNVIQMIFCLPVIWALDVRGAEPFWRAKPEVYERIKNERYVAISVLSKPTAEKQNHLTISGGGMMNVPQDYAFLAGTHYKNLSRVSDYVREVKFNASLQELYVMFTAFRYQAPVTLKLREDLVGDKKILHYTVIKGVFTGMTGRLEFLSLGPKRTEIGIWGDFRYQDWPIPKLFLEFGLEVVLQKFGERLRSLTESDYKKGVQYKNAKT
jgi:hypothetical protein